MEMVKVESSNIAEVGYDANSGRLRIRFISSGALYEYNDVPQNVAEDFMKADSWGSFFHQNIRHQHAGKKIKEPEAVEDEAANDAGQANERPPESDFRPGQADKHAGKKKKKRKTDKGKRHGNEDGETGSL